MCLCIVNCSGIVICCWVMFVGDIIVMLLIFQGKFKVIVCGGVKGLLLSSFNFFYYVGVQVYQGLYNDFVSVKQVVLEGVLFILVEFECYVFVYLMVEFVDVLFQEGEFFEQVFDFFVVLLCGVVYQFDFEWVVFVMSYKLFGLVGVIFQIVCCVCCGVFDFEYFDFFGG